MINRLPEIKEGAPPRTRQSMGHGQYSTPTMRRDETISSEISSCYFQFMPEYFRKSEQCQACLTNIINYCNELRKLRSKAAMSTRSDQDKENSRELGNLLQETKVQIGQCKKINGQMRGMTKADIKAGSISQHDVDIRENMRKSLAQRLLDCVKDYQDVQASYKATMQSKQARQLAVIFPDADEREIAEMAQSGAVSNDVILAQKMQGTHVSVQNQLATIRDKHNDVLRLEASIDELAQMFLEIAELVEQQGMVIDQVDMFVDEAITHQEKATQQYVFHIF